MARLTARWSGDGIVRLIPAMDLLSSDKAHTVYRRALNHTGNKTFTGVKRVLAKQVGVTQTTIVKRGALRKRPANFSSLEFRISSSGEYMPLKDFKPNQQKKGVKASPWGKRRLFESTFIVDKLGGHVWKRVGKARLPIEKLYGPSIPKEMVKDASQKEFYRIVSTSLRPRVEHELRRATKGVF